MVANGDDKPIWMTELSWRTTSAVCSEGMWAGQKPEGVSEDTQATFLRQAYHCLEQDPYVQVALWFPLADEHGTTSGLIAANGTHKPSYDAMREYAHKGDSLHEPCGTFTGPSIWVSRRRTTSPTAARCRSLSLAHSKVGVFRIRLELDGKLIRNSTEKRIPRCSRAGSTTSTPSTSPTGVTRLTSLA